MRKYLPYILILFIVTFGLFGAVKKTQAAGEMCWTLSGTSYITDGGVTVTSQATCSTRKGSDGQPGIWQATKPSDPAGTPPSQAGYQCVDASGIPNGKNQTDCTSPPNTWAPIPTTSTTNVSQESPFAYYATEESCINFFTGGIPGCMKSIFYYVIYQPSAFLLVVAAKFFNALISIALSSSLFSSSAFIPSAWAVVRDLSNIFFILVLLYVAIELILDVGGADAKKMITKVIIMALLINFSMFFTQVIIDTSNVLALVFYNKLNVNVNVKNTDGSTSARPYDPSVSGDKDISGAMYSTFDPTTRLNSDFFKKAATQTVNGKTNSNGHVPAGTIISIIIISAAIILFATYAFFVSGIAFVSRLIELWVLIIFSPFAFMSYTIPLLGGVEYIGWDAWLKRLLKVAFMAPIFMFFMYLIFLLIGAKLFDNLVISQDTIPMILSVLIPAMTVLILLMKATEYAKKGSGVLGDKLMAGAKFVGGLALGAATGGVAALGVATVGRAGAAIAESKWAKNREAQGKFGSGLTRDVMKGIGSSNFDVRGVKIAGKSLASATGMSLGEAGKGGFTERRKEQVEKRQKRAKELEVGENETLKQELNKTEADLQGLLGKNAQEIETVDKLIEKKRQEASDANSKLNAAKGTAGEAAAQGALKTANDELQDAKRRKTALVNGDLHTDLAGINHDYATNARITNPDGTTDTIETLEKKKKNKTQEIRNENISRRRSYADATEGTFERMKGHLFSLGQYSQAGARESAHKIRMEMKLDSGDKH